MSDTNIFQHGSMGGTIVHGGGVSSDSVSSQLVTAEGRSLNGLQE